MANALKTRNEANENAQSLEPSSQMMMMMHLDLNFSSLPRSVHPFLVEGHVHTYVRDTPLLTLCRHEAHSSWENEMMLTKISTYFVPVKCFTDDMMRSVPCFTACITTRVSPREPGTVYRVILQRCYFPLCS